jgi:hypothetical protein
MNTMLYPPMFLTLLREISDRTAQKTKYVNKATKNYFNIIF